jgi:hypothetical protein
MMPENEDSRTSWVMYAEWGDLIFNTLERMTILAAIYAAGEVTNWAPLSALYWGGMFALIMAVNGSISLLIFKPASEIPPLPQAKKGSVQYYRNLGARLPLFLIVALLFAMIAFGIPMTVERLIQAAA